MKTEMTTENFLELLGSMPVDAGIGLHPGDAKRIAASAATKNAL